MQKKNYILQTLIRELENKSESQTKWFSLAKVNLLLPYLNFVFLHQGYTQTYCRCMY